VTEIVFATLLQAEPIFQVKTCHI